MATTFSTEQLKIVRFCSEECDRQRSGELSVGWMVDAWDLAVASYERSQALTLEFIEFLGKLVEPKQNSGGFREIPIGVGNGIEWVEKAPWDSIPRRLDQLVSAYYEGRLGADDVALAARVNEVWGKYKYYKKAETAEDIFYFEYEEIHPFRDGNGRTGKILYNYLLGSLNDPQMPPNFWGISNP